LYRKKREPGSAAGCQPKISTAGKSPVRQKNNSLAGDTLVAEGFLLADYFWRNVTFSKSSGGLA
jgi:hypothetical protein